MRPIPTFPNTVTAMEISKSKSKSKSTSKSKHEVEEGQSLQQQVTKRPRGENEEVEATSDEEVEEFYAILRRMHAAQRLMSMSKENLSKSPEVEENKKITKKKKKKKATFAWRPTFQLEDFGQGDEREEEQEEGSEIVVKSDPIDGGKKLGEGKRLVFIDLNAEPDPDLTAVLG